MTGKVFQIIGFDLDGTMIDSSGDVADAVNRTLIAIDRPMLAMDAVRRMIGRGIRALIADVLAATGGGDEAAIDAALPHFYAAYAAQLSHHSRAYDALDATLDALGARDLTLAVCTNKPAALAEQLLTDLGLRRYFAALIGGDSIPGGSRKPHPAPIHAMIAAAGGGRTLFVGDSIHDVDAARAAGVPVVAVSYGYRDRPADALGADHVIDRLDSLPGLIDNWPR